MHRCRCPTQAAALHAVGVATAPAASTVALGRHLAGGRCYLMRALLLQERSPLQSVALAAGATYARRHQPCPWATAHAGSFPCKGLWPWSVAPLQGALVAVGLAVGGQPYMQAGHGWPPLLLAAFTGKRNKNA
ncbi:hypothetical protein GW17_00036344 [Ensete ventricosum]|nr:hypothetical protein GW17_00036344 [Ensete ventricosum]RZS00677.1 hypothetical protein BHM03_00030430 [Ensete ventricosum]